MRLALASLAIVIGARAAQAAPPKLAAHLAPLFELGRTWVYDTSLTTWTDELPNGKMRKGTTHDVVTCKVVSVVPRAAGLLSHITCDKDIYKLRVAGYYLGVTAGVHSFRAETEDPPPGDDELAGAIAEPASIDARPRPFRKVTHNRESLEPENNNIYITGIRTTPGGWCVYSDTTHDGPDGGLDSRCFVAGIGIASGQDNSGGELDDFRFVARK